MDGKASYSSTPYPNPLLPRQGLILTSYGQGDERRFARIFRDTWRRIPLPDRRLILVHWRAETIFAQHFSPSPHIALLTIDPPPDPSRYWKPRFRRHEIARCGCQGHELLFLAPVMDRMPDQHVAEIIAHELAHVFLHALGDRSRGPVAEIRADKVMRHWGFNPFANFDWYHLHVKGWSRKQGPIWRAEPASRKELALVLWDPQFPNWHPRYLNSRGRVVWDDWQLPAFHRRATKAPRR